MEHLQLPRTDLRVSALCLGTAEYGAGIDEATSFALLDAFAEAGGNFFDTAAVYAAWTGAGKGSSERLIGRWLASRRPQNVVIATKGAHPELHSMGVGRLTRSDIASDIEASLKNLKAEALDVWYLHRDDPFVPAGEVLTLLEEFRRAGKLRFYACSNWRASRIKEAQAAAGEMGVAGFLANQPLWSLAVPDMTGGDATLAPMDAEMMALHEATNLAAIPYASQANGYFQKIAEGKTLPASVETTYDTDLVRPTNRARLGRLETLSAATGHSLTGLVLGFLRGHPFPVVPIIGPRTLAQGRDSLTAGDVRLTAEQVTALAAPS